MASRRKVVVLGAGFAGLWLSWRLLAEGFEVEILEQSTQPGGLMETISRDGFLLDLGPHILLASHLDHYRQILGNDLLSVRGFYGFGYQGKQILSPLTPGNLFKTLGPQKAIPFAVSMALYKLPFFQPRPPWNNVDEMLTAKFGKRVNEAFFRSYIPKVTGLPVREVSEDWFLERYRFYQEHGLGKQLLKKTSQFLNGLLTSQTQESTEGLELYYPRKGAQMLTDMLFANISKKGVSTRLGSRVTRIHTQKGRVDSVTYETADRKSHKAEGDLFVSTLPLTSLVHLFDGYLGSKAEMAAKVLTWRHLWLFFVTVECERVSDKIQIYFTEKKYPFKRIYEPKNLISTMGTSDTTALSIEVCYSDGDSIDRTEEHSLFRTIREHLCELYRLSSGEIHYMFSRRVPYSYAVYKTDYRHHLGQIADALFPIDNFISYGRQGSFRYNHLVDRIIDASDSVMKYISHQQEGKKRFLKESNAKSDFF